MASDALSDPVTAILAAVLIAIASVGAFLTMAVTLGCSLRWWATERAGVGDSEHEEPDDVDADTDSDADTDPAPRRVAARG